MSADHKAALAQGRTEGRVVRGYLEALRDHKPKRGRRRTPDSVNARLAAIEEQWLTADADSVLHLVQERRDLHAELEHLQQDDNLSELEDAFVQIAKSYSERQGISYASWRDIGIPAAVLNKAGITRTRT